MQLMLSVKRCVHSALNLKPVFKLQVSFFQNQNFLQTLDYAFIFKTQTEEQYLLFPSSVFCLRTRQVQNKMTLCQVLLNQNNVFFLRVWK